MNLVVAALVSLGISNSAVAQNMVVQNGVVPQSYPTTTYPAVSYPTGSYPTNSYPTTTYPANSYPTHSYPVAQPTIANQERIVSGTVVQSPSPSIHNTPTRVTSRPTNTTSADASQRLAAPPLPDSTHQRTRTNDTRLQRSPATRIANYGDREGDTRLASSRTSYRTYPSSINHSGPLSYNDSRYQRDRLPDAQLSRYRQENIDAARTTSGRYQRFAENATSVIADAALENAALATQWAELADKYISLAGRVDKASDQLSSTSRDYEDVRSKLEHYGLTSTIGMLLRNKKEQLDVWQVQDSRTLFVSQELERSRQSQLQLEITDRNAEADLQSETSSRLADAGYDTQDSRGLQIRTELLRLLGERQTWINDLQQGYRDYQQKLGELDSVTTASTQLATDYRKLINRHITWIRSGDPISFQDVRDLRGGTAALFDSQRSADFGPTLERKLRAHSASGILLCGLIAVLFLIRWRAKTWLLGIGSHKRMRESSPGARKATASVLTVIVALALPAILYAVSRWLSTGIVSESTLYASKAFAAASLVLLVVEMGRHLFRNHGFINKHVDVAMPGSQRAVNYLTVIGFGLAVAAYTITLMTHVDHGIWRGSIARLGFMLSMLLTALTAHLALRPSGGALEPLIAKFGGSVIYRIRLMLYLSAIAFPLGMIVLAALGYQFTANELTRRALITLASVLIAATLWPAIKIASAGAWQLLTGTAPPPVQRDEYGIIENPAGNVAGALAEHSLELKHHLAFLCQCALVLGAIVCVGWLWLDVFPKVQMGNPVVWTVEDTVQRASVDVTGQTFTESVQETTPITLLHCLLAAATLWVAFQLAKLLPAMFDALVLQRVSFDEGMEHFSLVLGRSLLFGVGCLIACKFLGVRWQLIQWLAVGLTIGLGFGLQDMVRNLFGGLIVLFEKPARLGDLITVGKVTGRVAAQKLRTTVLSDDKGREIVIPNKNFVSEDVVNWMGAGRLQVIPIEVAVTRDQRPADICRTLQELALDQKHVLITPAPQATLVCVGKRSQRIEIRAWVEEDQDAERFRDNLSNVVTSFLKEKNWLARKQPPQPNMPTVDDLLSESRSSRTRSDRPRRRAG